MPSPNASTWVIVVFGALAVAVLVVGLVRRRRLANRVGSFVCQYTEESAGAAAARARAVAGVAQYNEGRIDWYRAWTMYPRPERTWYRERLDVVERYPIGTGRDYVVRCQHFDEHFTLTMGADAYAGLASWLEAAPPGAIDRVV
ncbi:MAG: DUF2550 domain-containing protein [Cellulomonadaceae bacterium]|jgi:hypothetical protein|nr:DUF2550 domain-containing protein [Cellulomonadaceae bacterium]